MTQKSSCLSRLPCSSLSCFLALARHRPITSNHVFSLPLFPFSQKILPFGVDKRPRTRTESMAIRRAPLPRPADVNRIREDEAVAMLRALCREVIENASKGTIGVELSVNDGQLMRVKQIRVVFGT